jgi:hypothetical protein
MRDPDAEFGFVGLAQLVFFFNHRVPSLFHDEDAPERSREDLRGSPAHALSEDEPSLSSSSGSASPSQSSSARSAPPAP